MKYKEINLADLQSLLNFDKPLMFDIETIGLYGKIRLAQFYQSHLEVPLIVEYPNIMQLCAILDKSHLVSHNISYEISTIQDQLGKIAWQPTKFDDTFLLSRLYYYKKDKFSLDSCIEYAINYNPYGSIEHKTLMQKSNWAAPVLTNEQKEYAANDVYYLQDLYDVVKGVCYNVNKYENTENLSSSESMQYNIDVANNLNYKVDILTLHYFFSFQCNGLPIDVDRINHRYKSNLDRLKELNLSFNYNSWQQTRKALNSNMSDKLGLYKLKSQGCKLAGEIIECRSLSKVNQFLEKFSNNENLIYGKFSPTAKSGRSVCKDQNLQQLPRSTKNCFGLHSSITDKVIAYVDFSQIEMRCACVITGDKVVENLYKDNKDLHTYAAQKIFNTLEPTKEERRIAKTCNFGLLYGAGVETFRNILLTSTSMVLDEAEAKTIVYAWRKLYPEIYKWQQKGISDWNNGIIWQTPWGRRYSAKRITDQLNIQVQGMAADVAKLALHYMYKKFKEDFADLDYKSWLRNFIHDSYLFVIDKDMDFINKFCIVVVEAMQTAWNEIIKHPFCKINQMHLPTSITIGTNWGDIEEDKNVLHCYKN